MTFKEIVHQGFLESIKSKIELVQQVLNDLHQSAANETKSTAGDKHETALAMLQIEQANKRTQMANLIELQNALLALQPSLPHQVIARGSLIKANHYYFYISAALGKLVVNEEIVFALSPAAPLAQALLGLRITDTINFAKENYTIDGVW